MQPYSHSLWISPNEEKVKKCLVNSILRFLEDEILLGTIDKKESLKIAVQYMESAYEMDSHCNDPEYLQRETLLKVFTRNYNAEKEKLTAAAQQYNNTGNDFMINGFYKEAVDQYTRAIELIPDDILYFWNRSTAFGHLQNHQSLIDDCEKILKLDPGCAKACGRLGTFHLHCNASF